MNIVYNGFFHCECGKLHTTGGLSYSSKCKCGKNLWHECFSGKANMVGHKRTFG